MDKFLEELTELSRKYNRFIYGCNCGADPIIFALEAIKLTGKDFDPSAGQYYLQADGSFGWHNFKEIEELNRKAEEALKEQEEEDEDGPVFEYGIR